MTAPVRRPSRRDVLGGLLLAPFVAAAAGCAPARTPAPGPAAGPSALASAGPVAITLWHGLGGAAGAALADAVTAFNRTNALGITANAVYQGSYVDVQAKYIAALRDGSTPALLLSSDTTTGFMRDVGTTTSAQEMAAANPDDLDLDDLRAAARSYYTADDVLLSVPFNTSLPMLYVNDDLLERAGADRGALATMAGLDAAARTTATLPGVHGFVHPLAEGWWFEQVTAAAGEPYLTPDNGRSAAGAAALSLDGPRQARALQVLTDLHVDGVALAVGSSGDAAVQAFAAGQVALMLNSSGAIGSLVASGAGGWSTLPLPLSADPSGAGPLVGGASLWVDGATVDPASQLAAWKLVTHLTSPGVQEAFCRTSGYAPVNTRVDDSPTQQQFLADNPAWRTALEQFDAIPISTATAGALTGALPAVRSEVTAAMQRAYAGDVSLAEAIAAAQEAARPIISDYREQATAT